jgi:hypothetical protein
MRFRATAGKQVSRRKRNVSDNSTNVGKHKNFLQNIGPIGSFVSEPFLRKLLKLDAVNQKACVAVVITIA